MPIGNKLVGLRIRSKIAHLLKGGPCETGSTPPESDARREVQDAQGRMNLLVVEDDAALRTSLSHIFASFGHRVRCAADGFSAIPSQTQSKP